MYGLIGKPLRHSFSQKFFTEKFKVEHIDESYKLFELDNICEVEGLIMRNQDLRGFNVTIPYKKQIIPFLTSLSEDAREIGAVNVVSISRDDNDEIKLTGYNSDAPGFLKSLEGWLGEDVDKALILGTGGASQAVEYALKKKGLEVVKVSRKPSCGQLAYKDLDKQTIDEYKLIVNCTPLGTFPEVDESPDIPYELLTKDHYCYDLVYNPSVTKFMELASNSGAKVKNGLDMLHNQAVIAWDIWNK